MASSPDALTGGHHCLVFGNGSGDREDTGGANHSSFLECGKNPGHERFMTIEDFRRRGPSSLVPNPDHLAVVRNAIRNTVRIELTYTSHRRPDTYNQTDFPYPLREIRGSYEHLRYGTGFLLKEVGLEWIDLEGFCPCLICSKSKSTKLLSTSKHSNSSRIPTSSSSSNPDDNDFSAFFVIFTAAHVLFDSLEAQNAAFEFFYDSEEDRRNGLVERVYGIKVLYDERKRLETDLCRVLCVTHDARLAGKLREMIREGVEIGQVLSSNPPPPFLVSHPHGVSKRISFGEFIGFHVFMVNEHAWSVTLKKGLRVRISSTPDTSKSDIAQMLNLKPADEVDDIDESTYVNNNNKDNFEDKTGAMSHKDSTNCIESRQTFTMLSDLTVYSPLPIILHSSGDLETKDKWWTLPKGLSLVTDQGTHVAIPFSQPQPQQPPPPSSSSSSNSRTTNPREESSVTLEIYIGGFLQETPLLRYASWSSSSRGDFSNDEFDVVGDEVGEDKTTTRASNASTSTSGTTATAATTSPTTAAKVATVDRLYWRRYRRYEYNMASCPGSSGAMVRYRYLTGKLYGYAAAHFGRLGGVEGSNASVLSLF